MAKLFNFKKGSIIFINILLLIQINIFVNCYPFSSSNINLINEIKIILTKQIIIRILLIYQFYIKM